LGIYELPSLVSANKFSKKGLMRFDEIDLADCPLSLCGSSKLWPNDSNEIIPQTEKEAVKDSNRPLRLIVFSNQGVRKPLFLKTRDLKELFRQAAQKLRLKKSPTSAFDEKGVKLAEEDLVDMGDDSVIRVF
jgi:hypothetical protein